MLIYARKEHRMLFWRTDFQSALANALHVDMSHSYKQLSEATRTKNDYTSIQLRIGDIERTME